MRPGIFSAIQRHKSISIERRYLEYRAHEEKRQKALAERKSLHGEYSDGGGRGDFRKSNVCGSSKAYSIAQYLRSAELPAAGRKTLMFDRALEAGMEFQEQSDRLLNAAYVRRREALELLEIYRNGLGQHPKRAAPEIIDGEFEEASAPIEGQQVPIVPKLEGQSE